MEKYALHGFANAFEEDVYRYLSSHLQSLTGDYILFGPVRIGRRELDGLVIGNGFIVALETKAVEGRVSKGANTPVAVRTSLGEIIDFQDRYEDPFDQAEKHWKELSAFVRNAFGDTGIRFISMLVFKPGSTFDVFPQSRDINSGSSLIVALDEIPNLIRQLSSRFTRVKLSYTQQKVIVKAIIHGREKLTATEKKVFSRSVVTPPELRTGYASPAPRASIALQRPARIAPPCDLEKLRTSLNPPARKPWVRSNWFLAFAFFLLHPLWTVLMITDRKKHCLYRLVAMAYLIAQLFAGAEILYLSRYDPGFLRLFALPVVAAAPLDTPVPDVPARASTPETTGAATLPQEPASADGEACTLIWAETGAEGLANKNRSMVWEEFIEARVAGSGMTAKQFYAQVVEYNPVLKADGYVFKAGNTYFLPQCE